MHSLAKALKERPEKFDGKAVKSHRSRVTNISEHLTRKMDVVEFMEYLADYVDANIDHTAGVRRISAIEEFLKSRYRRDSWNLALRPNMVSTRLKFLQDSWNSL